MSSLTCKRSFQLCNRPRNITVCQNKVHRRRKLGVRSIDHSDTRDGLMTKSRTVIGQHPNDAAAIGTTKKGKETDVIVATWVIFGVRETFVHWVPNFFGFPEDGISIWIYNPESPNCPEEFKWLQGPGSFHFIDLEYDFAPMQSILGIVMVFGLVI